ncbi:MAG: M36 family metallopeptidase [Rubrobacteraceae bacterium]
MRSVTVRGWMLAGVFTLALCVSVVIVWSSGAGAILPLPGEEELEEVFDSRGGVTELLESQADASEALGQEVGSGFRIEFDDYFGTPRKISKSGGYLTGATSGTAEEVARGWISANDTLFGLSAEQVENLEVIRDHELPGTGTNIVTFQQVFGGVETAFGGRLNVAVKEDGRILSYAGNPTRGEELLGDFSALTEADALSAAAGELGSQLNLTLEPLEEKVAGWTVFEAETGEQSVLPQYVKPVAFPARDGATAAFRVIIIEQTDEAHEVIIAADGEEVLFRRNLVHHQDAEGLVYKNHPGAEEGGEQETVSFDGDPNASPCGWLDPASPDCTTGGVDGAVTTGNNADSFENWETSGFPDAPNPAGQRANDSDLLEPGTQFNYDYENNWGQSNGAQGSYVQDLNPAATSLFWHHNRIHDEYYELGFTETAGNFQTNNYGRGGAGQDEIWGLVQAGAASGSRNNAYMLTLPDGVQSWSGMFLWEPLEAAFISPYVDGDFDASVIQHEYTHGLTNRYVAGGESLGAFQSGAMGEGWSDWYALDYLYKEGLEDEAVEGKYVTGNEERGIRNWNYDETPLTYGDIGYDITGPGVHADGEIWAATLWDMRKALVEEFGEERGGEIARRLVTDAQPLTAPDPSYLDARDGILLADQDRYDGAHNDLVWTVFARRGMGASASTEGGDDTDPVPGFDHIDDERNGRIVGKVVNLSNDKPVEGARVLIGNFEARATPITETGDGGGFGAEAVEGTYSLTVQAPGFGSRTFNGIEVAEGESTKIEVTLSPNLASLRSGAEIKNVSSEDPDNPARNLLDDSEATVWSTEQSEGDFEDAQISVKLRDLAEIRAFRLSAFKNIADSRFSAMKKWTFETSTAGKKWKARKRGKFRTDDPRPVTPELAMRKMKLNKPVESRFVRLSIRSIQDDSVGYAQAAEFEVFSNANERINPLRLDSDETFTDTGEIAQGNPSIGTGTLGVTGDEFTTTCEFPPRTQGTDGYVSELPEGFGDGNHVVAVEGDEPQDQDLDLYFLNSECEVLGAQATPSANESGVLPGGTKYVLTALYLNDTGSEDPESFTLTAESAP